MKTKKNSGLTLAILSVMLILPTSLFSQVNFSGTWTLNQTKSNLGEGMGGRMAAKSLTIVQQANDLTVDRTQDSRDGEEMKTTSKYTLDGKECANTGIMNSKLKSTVTWSADKATLSFANTMVFDRDGDPMEIKSTEAWKLTDAKTLSIASQSTTPMGDTSVTLVYDKK